MVTITKLHEDRWKEYRDLRLDSLQSEPIAFGSSYDEEKDIPEEEWKRRLENVLFAVLDGKVVGMMAYTFDSRLKIKHIGHIRGVYVMKEYRGHGIGNTLMDYVIKETQNNKNIVKLTLTVTPEQISAVNLYKKHGFTIVGQLEKDFFVDGKFYGALIMEKIFKE